MNFDLGRMLDDAAQGFSPDTDPARLHALLRRSRGRRRGAVVVLSAAAGIAAVAGTTLALQAGDHGTHRLAPAQSPATTGVEPPATPTTKDPSTTTEAGPSKPSTVVVTIDPSKADAKVHVTMPPKVTEPAPPSSEKASPPPTSAKPTPPPTTEKPKPPATEPGPTTTKPAPPPMGFTAAQVWGTCGEDPPYEELYGTAAAGSTVTVSSPFGGGSITASEKGKWWIKVFFPTAPVNEQFTITVSSPQGVATFTYMRTG